MRLDTLRERLRACGANPQHEARVLRLWSQALPQDSGRRALDSFMPATRCALARTPSATAGRPRPWSPSRGAAISSIKPASISSCVMVVTEAGLTPSSLASWTRGMSPAARTRS